MNCLVLVAAVAVTLLTSPSCSIKNDEGSIWALLIAGSNDFSNYRHQADVCHAYQILSKHGVPDDHIIVVMYDDIANNSRNKHKGKIINKPGGPDVYHGVPKDYTGKTITPKNIINIMLGNSEAMKHIGSGKVLKSGPNDRVFIYYSDHGATGLVAVIDEVLTANQLMDTLKKMHQQKMYKELVFYLEACESGSMFTNLPSNISVYSTTASNAEESSYAVYYDEVLETYLGDEYSVHWMENSDAAEFDKETLQQQFQTVKQLTKESHVQEFGDKTISAETLQNFLGHKVVKPELLETVITERVSSRSVPESLLYRAIQVSSGEEKERHQRALDHLITNNAKTSELVKTILKEFGIGEKDLLLLWSSSITNINYRCYEPIVKQLASSCFHISKNDHALSLFSLFAKYCSMPEVDIDRSLRVISTVCSERI